MIIYIISLIWLAVILFSSLYSDIDLIPFISDYSAKRKLIRAIPLSVISGIFISKAIEYTIVVSLRKTLGLYKSSLIILIAGITIAIYSDHIIRTIKEIDEKTE